MILKFCKGFTLTLSFALVIAAAIAPAQEGKDPAPRAKTEIVFDARIGQSIVKGQLLVTLHKGVKTDDLKPIFERLNAKYEIVDRFESLNMFTLAVDHNRLPELRQRLSNHPYLAMASFNTIVSARQGPMLKKPAFNDPVFKKPDGMLESNDNWNLFRIKANEAWDITTGGATIAIVDTGSRLDHEELTGRTVSPWTFAADPTAREGVKKLRRADGSEYEEEVRDHGTHVAITAAGTANNGVGTSGVAPASPVMPIQVLYYKPDENGVYGITGSTAEIAAGVDRAIKNGAAVINMSLGVNYKKEVVDRWQKASPEERLSIENSLLPNAMTEMQKYAPVLDAANRAGVIIVASAGNQSMPAYLYELPLSQRVISVAATTRDNKRADFSNHGPYTNVSAPGNLIYSGLARPDKDGAFYGYLSGTSMAAPHVTGIVALMKTIDPGLKHADVVDILMKTGQPIDSEVPIGPLVNAKAALDETKRRRAVNEPRMPEPLPLVPTPPIAPTTPELPNLPPEPIDVLTQPDPWNNPNVQRIIQVWLSIAIAQPPQGGDPNGVWIFNQFGQSININININIQRPIWAQFSYRWLWENSLTLQSTNVGSLYEFVVGTLRQGRFNPAPPRVEERFRPRPTDPRPPQEKLPFDSTLNNTRWTGRNTKLESIEFDFTKNIVVIKRGNTQVRYRVVINTYLTPNTIDLYPEAGGAPMLGLLQMVNLGEIVFRCDFTAKRPGSISRGDPLAFILRRTDVTIAPHPGANDDGVQLPMLFRGTESLIRSLDYPAKIDPKTAWTAFGKARPWTYALSGDGKRIWIVLESPTEKDLAKKVEIWSMNTHGGDARQSAFDWPKEPGRFESIHTTTDGSIAWFYNAGLLQVASPGAKAQTIVNTAKLKGIGVCSDLRLTADGKSLFAITDLGLTRFGSDGSHHVVLARKDIKFNNLPLSNNLRGLDQLAISDDGSRFAMHASFQGSGAKAPQTVLVGSPNGVTHIPIDNKDGTFDRCTRLGISGDGETVLIRRESRIKGGAYPFFLWRNGQTRPILVPIGYPHNTLLSADGQTMTASVRNGGGDVPVVAFTENLMTGQRRRVMSGLLLTRWDTWWTPNDIRYIQQSRNGDTILSMPEYKEGLYLFRAGAAPSPAHPVIKSVRQRYEGGNLIFTVEASSPEKLKQVVVLAVKDGYMPPHHVVPASKNPLGYGFGIFRAVSVAKRDGVYQVTVQPGSAHAYLDASYSIRVIAVNAEDTRATFQDYAVLR